MREIHDIMEALYEEEKNLTKEEIIARIKKNSQQLIEERALKLERYESKSPGLAVGKSS